MRNGSSLVPTKRRYLVWVNGWFWIQYLYIYMPKAQQLSRDLLIFI